jgi:DNA-binding PadR family transcriptional regulator
MLSRLILGLLRDGRARHGYDLISDYRRLSGDSANPGNFYRELASLAKDDFLTKEAVPPGEDPRRIPYRITQLGTTEFDTWLCSPTTPQEHLTAWLLFVDRVPSDVLSHLLETTRNQLWLQGKTLEHARANLRHTQRDNGSAYHPASFLILWHLKRVTADLEFLDEFRREIESILLSRTPPPKGDPKK